MLLEFSEHEDLKFHMLVICFFFILDTASVLSNKGSIYIYTYTASSPCEDNVQMRVSAVLVEKLQE